MISNYLLYLNALPFDEQKRQLFILIICISIILIALITFVLLKFKFNNKKKLQNKN